jgi:L-ascorbate metabolism protein UlaG (beta-lactamase superfamily)
MRSIFVGIPGAFMYNAATMVITHHGGQCFKVSFGDTILAFDPISKKSSLSPIKFGVNVALVSMNHPDFNGIEEVTYGNKEPFIVNGPGEYEIGDVTVRGFGVETTYEKVQRYATIYQVNLEGMNIVFLGAVSDEQINDPKILGELGDIDILFIPIGGGDVLDVAQASKLATKLEARVIIPMHYDKKALDAFLKEEGSQNGAPQEKLTIKKKDLLNMEGEIVVLKA